MSEQGVAAYAAADVKSELLIEDYGYLVKRIAYHLAARLPDNVQVEDLIQAGMLGLLEANSKYDSRKGASFETYAGIRIRGAMLDEVRKGDWVPRSVHRNSRRVARAVRDVESRNGREANDKDVASAMGIDIVEYHSILKDASNAKLSSFEELSESDERPETTEELTVAQRFEHEQFRERLVGAIRRLTERQQLIMALYYTEELNLKEIGAIIDVSESRVSQILSQTARQLGAELAEWRKSG